jgi:beta-lactamase class A
MSTDKRSFKFSRHLAVIATFTVSSLVVLALGAYDLQFVNTATANAQLRLTEESDSQLENDDTGREFTEGDDNRQARLQLAQSELDAFLDENNLNSDYGIYFQDLNNDEIVYSHNEDNSFRPASIYKVALAMVTIRNAEEGQFSLDETAIHEGEEKTLERIIELMIIESDNDAMSILEGKNGGYTATQEQITTELNGAVIKRIGQDTSPLDIARVFRKLYINTDNYLSPQRQTFLVDLMVNAEDRHRDRIPAAIDEFNQKYDKQLVAATKIGNLLGVYQDAGIIYGENSDYVLIIMNQNKKTSFEAIAEIKTITNILLEKLENNIDEITNS